MSNWRDEQKKYILVGRDKARNNIRNLKSGSYSAKNIRWLFDPFLLRNDEYWGFVHEMIEPKTESGMVEINMRLIKFSENELGVKYVDVSTERNSSGIIPILRIK